MPGLWKAWKAKSRLPPLSTSPLGISPRAGEIPTFPQRRRRRRMEKWKTKSRFSTFPPPRILALSNQTTKPGGARPSGADLSQVRSTKGDIAQQPHSQAHPVLESKSRFRLIAHWNQFSISGSFLDWKMLLGPGWPDAHIARRLGQAQWKQAHSRPRSPKLKGLGLSWHMMSEQLPTRGAVT